MITVNNLVKRFPQGITALNSVRFTVADGECLVISGANGSGKSVLMNLIASLDNPTAGTVSVVDAAGKAQRVGLVFQDADSQILGETVLEDVCIGPRNLGFSAALAEEKAVSAIERCGLGGKEHHPARTLSGGEKRRLAVAGILAMDCSIIIFDEPFANLDWPGVCQVNGIIRSLHASGHTVLILTHELEKVLALADRLLVLFKGSLVWEGPPDAALLSAPLESWGIRNPLRSYREAADCIWEES